ncbi:Flp pilus assembly protein TadG [Desulfobaculum xiamenense]|uniref:Flp pilus assembly protein TadG n=1 Tax=Desulfobaculum xiamenense TaxID=995050 RepID=A0A846QM17_9BACT|nr:TadE/TadG family type IV pilus assembly protein [Desulfobaculum xiamenense]NJB67263.1 Flp pilus assembly protein TadG [Desulfobaculum xiamenense]
MTRTPTRERGMAAVEIALLLPILAVLVYCVVEGGNLLSAYTDVRECSRQAARMIASEHAPQDATALARALAPDLDPEHLTATVIRDTSTDKVTVEVNYVYHTHFKALPSFVSSAASAYTLVARTSMPAL